MTDSVRYIDGIAAPFDGRIHAIDLATVDLNTLPHTSVCGQPVSPSSPDHGGVPFRAERGERAIRSCSKCVAATQPTPLAAETAKDEPERRSGIPGRRTVDRATVLDHLQASLDQQAGERARHALEHIANLDEGQIGQLSPTGRYLALAAAVLDRPTLPNLTATANTPEGTVRASLRNLERLGVLTHHPDRDEWRPTPP